MILVNHMHSLFYIDMKTYVSHMLSLQAIQQGIIIFHNRYHDVNP